MTENQEEFILNCIEKQIDGTLKNKEAEKLEKLILQDKEACTFYNDFMAHHAALRDNPPSKAQIVEEEKKHYLIIFYKVALTAAVLAIAFLGVMLTQEKYKGKVEEIATITQTENCRWLNSSLPTDIGHSLQKGKLSLETGLATIKFHSGAEVILEAPATIELIDKMHCRILEGTALAKVPEQAKGFTIDTPSASAIDHGTEFLVSYNSKTNQSLVDVIDGEVEVRPLEKETSKRLFTGDSALLNTGNFEEEKPVEGMPIDNQSIAANSITVTTENGEGDDGYVVQSKFKGHSSDVLVMVKNSDTAHKRKGYLKFDLRNQGSGFNSVALHLSIQPSGYGFASLVPDSTFTIYGLTEDSLDNWNSNELNWENAPANTNDNKADTTKLQKLGSFEVKRGVYSGIVTVESQELTDFIKSDTNKIITIIILRDTGEYSRHGLVHAFASKRHPNAMPPTLELKK